ncbi:nodulation protein NodZ [Gryllotalpicola koreensis]|uniref:Nodulation protein Z (NodZ) n=1 Tax=Gryllotalpicola koreensis TaxID=993086 RepID=A0ABP7ZP98_9MICO
MSETELAVAGRVDDSAVGESAPVLLIKAKGGFGNRILAATTGIILAELTGRTAVIDWREGGYAAPGVNAYPLLFEDPVGVPISAFDDRVDVTPALWSGRVGESVWDLMEERDPKDHTSPFAYRRYSLDLARPAAPNKLAVFWSYLPKTARITAQVRRTPRFRGMTLDDVTRRALDRYFRPNPRVRAEVDRVFTGREHPIIGVHIRYTDRKVSLGRIFREVTRLRKRMPEAAIFLATDNARVQAEFCARFDDVFVIDKALGDDENSLHEKVVLDDQLREAENALIDMWSLARCDWLVHSRHSTFSVAAAQIGGIPTSRQRDVDRWNARVVLKRWFQRWA